MKKIYSLIIFIAIASVNSFAQWIALTGAPAAELRGVFFTNAWTGYVVGSGTIAGGAPVMIKTTDGGITWTPMTSGITDTLRAVFFTGADTGFVCGANGRIMKTMNAGATWDTISSSVNHLLRSIWFPSHDTGYIAGGFGTILKTSDGGSTWTQQVSGTTSDLINIRFASDDTGFAVSSSGTFSNGIVLKTVNGGTSWTVADTSAQGFLGLAVVNANTIFAGGAAQTIIRTNNGGTAWTQVYTGTAGTQFRGAFFTSPSVGWFAGDAGSLLGTTDGGNTWTPSGITAAGLLGIHFPQSDTGYAVGNSVIVKYMAPCTPLLPAPGAVTGDTAVCGHDTASYFIHPFAGAASYHWTTVNDSIISGQGDTLVTVVFGATGGTHYMTASGVNLCGPGAGSSLPVTVTAPPPVPLISLIGSTLVATGTSNHQWYRNGVLIPGATSNNYSPTQSGIYTVTVTNTAGCVSTSAPYSLTNVGISETAGRMTVPVIPNPFHSSARIMLPDHSEKLQLIISDLCGKEVWSQTVSGNEILISRNNLDNGMYLYRLTGENKCIVATGKMIVN